MKGKSLDCAKSAFLVKTGEEPVWTKPPPKPLKGRKTDRLYNYIIAKLRGNIVRYDAASFFKITHTADT